MVAEGLGEGGEEGVWCGFWGFGFETFGGFLAGFGLGIARR